MGDSVWKPIPLSYFTTMAIHMFDLSAAKVFGVEEAVILKNIIFWLKKNKANNKHFKDERTWTYNSMAAFAAQFEYFTPKQIRRILDNLVKKGILVTGVYNKVKYDKTKWYAVENESILEHENYDFCKWYEERKSLCPNGQTSRPNRQNKTPKRAKQNAQIGEPIPDSLTYNNTDVYLITNVIKGEEKIGDVAKEFETYGEPEPLKKEKKKTPPSSASTPPRPATLEHQMLEAYAAFMEQKGIPISRNEKGHVKFQPREYKSVKQWADWASGMPNASDTLNDWQQFLEAAWATGDKWLLANFEPNILYSKRTNIVTAIGAKQAKAKELMKSDGFIENLLGW